MIHILSITIYIYKKKQVVKMDVMCQFYIGHHVNVNLDAFVKMEARMFFSHPGCLHMDGDRKWFWSP
jgi:hypothetical protein